jgi:hypothetical protein
MRLKYIGCAIVLAASFALFGCDSGGGGASPKAENTQGVQLKQLPAPGSPGGGTVAPKGAAGGKAGAD